MGEMLVKMLNEYTDKKDGYLEVMRCLLREIIIESVRKVGSRKQMSPLTVYITEEVEKHFSRAAVTEQIVSRQALQSFLRKRTFQK